MEPTVDQALTASVASVKASLDAFHPFTSSRPRTSTTSPIPPLSQQSDLPTTPDGLANSFSALLQQSRQTVTSLSLSFKPPLSDDAALAQLNTLNERYGQLASCVVLATGSANVSSGSRESYLVQEWGEGVVDLGNQILGLLESLREVLRDNSIGEGSSNDKPAYLARTGMVWDAIDKVLKDLSVSENHAVREKWSHQSEVMRDAWEEFNESLEDSEAVGDGDSDGDGGDGLGDFDDFEEIFGVKPEKGLSHAELERAKAAKSLLSVYRLLHTSLLRCIPTLEMKPDKPYTSFLVSGDGLAAAFDDTVAAFGPGQDTESVEEALQDLRGAADQLVKVVHGRLEASKAQEKNIGQCRSFLQKWTERRDSESKTFAEYSLSLASLADAL